MDSLCLILCPVAAVRPAKIKKHGQWSSFMELDDVVALRRVTARANSWMKTCLAGIVALCVASLIRVGSCIARAPGNWLGGEFPLGPNAQGVATSYR